MSIAHASLSGEALALLGREQASRFLPWLTVCLGITLLLTGASLVVGTSDVHTSITWLMSPDAMSDTVLWHIRLPRAVGAWLAGALLGLGGAIAQSLFRNPLADPYLLGSASGAALGVTVSLLAVDASLSGFAWVGGVGVTAAAFIGACGAIALTVALSRGVLETASLLLAGIVVAFVLSAVTSLLLLRSPDTWRTMQTFLLGNTGFLDWRAASMRSCSGRTPLRRSDCRCRVCVSCCWCCCRSRRRPPLARWVSSASSGWWRRTSCARRCM
jgi:iron complex transport system permease protein